MAYRIPELEKLRLLLEKQHRSAKDVAVTFKIMLEKCVRVAWIAMIVRYILMIMRFFFVL